MQSPTAADHSLLPALGEGAGKARTMVSGPAPFDAVVIGSGFGGSVSALRLAESGRRVLVLERGPRRSGDQFPRLGKAGIRDWLWTSRWNGFFDLRVFGRIATLTS